MVQELEQPFFWKYHTDRLAHQLDPVSEFCDLVSQGEIVRMVVCHGFESANFRKPLFRGGHCPPEGEINSADPSRHEHVRRGIAGDADGVEVTRKVSLRDAPKKGGDHSD